VSWSRKLSIGECDLRLDGCPLHVTKCRQSSDWCLVETCFMYSSSVGLWAFVAMMGWGFIQLRMWFRLGTTVVVVMNGGCRCLAGAKHPERTRVKLRGEAFLRRGNLLCLARELAFWWCGRVSLSITKVKQQRARVGAWSALGWAPATCYSSFTCQSRLWHEISVFKVISERPMILTSKSCKF
jgi:hypothetical protein